MCDEPTASLDGENVEIFMNTLLEIKKSTDSAIVIVTYDNRVFNYGENKIYMIDGELKAF